MSQQNYIQNIDVPLNLDGIYNDQVFYFSGFLFYVDGWSWDRVNPQSNIDYAGVLESISGAHNISSPFDFIRSVKSSILPAGTNLPSIYTYTSAELYLMAATCRRYQIYNEWREKYTDIIAPRFLESYSEDIPSRAPDLTGELTWSLWSGDIQSYSNSPLGNIGLGSYIFAKKTDLQKYTPVSIERSSKNRVIDKGFGEIEYDQNGFPKRYITNYYNSENTYIDELSTLKDGWYGVVTLDSTPYVLQAGIGIDFDTFISLKSNQVVEFHPDYPGENYPSFLSNYGRVKRQYIDN